MDARTAIRHLLDEHGDVTGNLSRRQLADLAKVNAGQLSNWIRGEGPLGVENAGRVVQSALDRVQTMLNITRPTPALEECLTVLAVHVPRLFVRMEHPDAAWKGEPVAYDSSCYVSRCIDEHDVETLRHDPTHFAVVGGPKTGKSSLLLKVWAACRATYSTIYVDFRNFSASIPADKFCGWLQDQCEAQIGSDLIGPRVLRHPDDFELWIQSNILPCSVGNRCLLLFDHPEALPSEALRTFDVVLDRYNWPQQGSTIKQSCGIILGYDPAHRNLHSLNERFADGFRQAPMVALSDHQVEILARRAYDVSVDGREVIRSTGGCAFLTHTLFAETHGKAPAGTSERALRLMVERMRTDWDEEFRHAVVEALSTGDGIFKSNQLWQFDALCSGGLCRWAKSPELVRTASCPISEVVRYELVTKLVAV